MRVWLLPAAAISGVTPSLVARLTLAPACSQAGAVGAGSGRQSGVALAGFARRPCGSWQPSWWWCRREPAGSAGEQPTGNVLLQARQSCSCPPAAARPPRPRCRARRPCTAAQCHLRPAGAGAGGRGVSIAMAPLRQPGPEAPCACWLASHGHQAIVHRMPHGCRCEGPRSNLRVGVGASGQQAAQHRHVPLAHRLVQECVAGDARPGATVVGVLADGAAAAAVAAAKATEQLLADKAGWRGASQGLPGASAIWAARRERQAEQQPQTVWRMPPTHPLAHPPAAGRWPRARRRRPGPGGPSACAASRRGGWPGGRRRRCGPRPGWRTGRPQCGATRRQTRKKCPCLQGRWR